MSSQSDFQQSSSSGMQSPGHKKDPENQGRERSRSRQKSRSRKHDRDQYPKVYQSLIVGSSRKTLIKMPQLNYYLVSFKVFYANQTEKISKQRAQKEYEHYKRDWQEYQNQLFLGQHKDDAWFKQKYNPQILDLLDKQRKQNSKNIANQFNKLFQQGYFDNINLTIQDPTTLGFISNNDKDQEQQVTTVPINSQSLDISLNYTIDVTKQPFYAFDPDHLTLFIKQVPRTVSRDDIYEVLSKFPGFKSLCMSDPVKKMSFARYCWIEFHDQASFKDAQMKMSGLIIKNQPLPVSPSISKNKRVKVLKKYPKSRLVTDSQTALALIKALDKQCQIKNNTLYQTQFNNPQKSFDTYLLYLRRVHAYDYFSGTSFQNERMLCLKLGLCYLRIQVQYQELPDFPTVFKKAQQAAQKRMLNIEPVDNWVLVKQQVQKMVLENLKIPKDQIMSDMIWKCHLCPKKFKTYEFLAKHIITKHIDSIQKKIQSIMEIAYLKDPNKITNYPSSREEREYRGKNRGNFRKDRRRDNYRDLDEPEGQRVQKVATKPMINFLNI